MKEKAPDKVEKIEKEESKYKSGEPNADGISFSSKRNTTSTKFAEQAKEDGWTILFANNGNPYSTERGATNKAQGYTAGAEDVTVFALKDGFVVGYKLKQAEKSPQKAEVTPEPAPTPQSTEKSQPAPTPVAQPIAETKTREQVLEENGWADDGDGIVYDKETDTIIDEEEVQQAMGVFNETEQGPGLDVEEAQVGHESIGPRFPGQIKRPRIRQ